MSSNQDWRVVLQEWLKKNPKVIPDDLKKLREDFVKSFPMEKLSEMTLDQYAAGKHDPQTDSTFCHWIEFRTGALGGIRGGGIAKLGIYWSPKKDKWEWNKLLQADNAESAFQTLKNGLVNLIKVAKSREFDQLDNVGDTELGKNRNSLRAKPLYLYFPEDFLPISNPTHLDNFLRYFNQIPKDGLHTKNHQLLAFLRSQSEFDGFDTLQLMYFLYHLLPQSTPDTERTLDTEPVPKPAIKLVQYLLNILELSKNLIVYGSPGTGKTFTVNGFAKLFLDKQLQSPITPEQLKLDAIKGLTWHDAIAFAMYVNYKKGKLFKVTELVKDDLIDTFWKTTKTQKLSNMIHAMLQIHTDVSVETVKYGISKRQLPYLFEKTKDGDWFLTDLGREYVEENLSEQLQNLKESTEIVADISKYLRFVTFHQSFAYEEFVEGIKPITDEAGEVSYRVADGVFKQICRQAELDSHNKYLIIIDEINRANIAKVFGELITLIEDDKRIGARNELKVTLPYAQEEFGVPKNLYILGTMNTSDRSIALLDIALRRRFTFIELKPDPELLKEIVIDGIHCDRLLTQLNKRITLLIGRDYQIGHSYFMNIENIEDLRFTWYHRIIPLLQEYFYHDSKRLSAVIGSEFMQPIDISDIPDTLRDFRGIETQYEIADLQGEDFTKALSKIA
jgi:5-methylcytosine-specific restriction enzyme B